MDGGTARRCLLLKAVYFLSHTGEKYEKLWTQGKIKIKLILKIEDRASSQSGRLVVDARIAEMLKFHQRSQVCTSWTPI